MTTVSEIITDAFRQSNLIATGAAPTDAEITEALRYLNRIVKSVFGNEAGEALQAFPLGRTNITTPAGYPFWGNSPSGDWFVAKNIRLMLNLDEATTVALHPAPNNGSRFAVMDVASNLATYPLTVNGNGRLIEGATSITLNTDDTNSEWFYREDQANWVKYAPLVAADTFPFPIEFDDFFITMLAIRLNPSYGIALDSQSQFTLNRSRTQLRARYAQNEPVHSEIALVRLSKMSAERDAYQDWGLVDDNAAFNIGWPFFIY